ncbi:uncharacterized protein LOC131162162 isoform X3 [Malania oleifera]|uniref:uncharacterized protein LOC131162162 isoform X3 n=1 Tax=Malania oleifera TaxID=397392 RepID=UPI0025AE9992|nr:uncharacterized protein LOC131162162 isoform X3 [Malania oleifera]
MADQHAAEGSSTSRVLGESSDSTVEINIKTLDSQIYSFHVDKNMRVLSFKEKIANEVGVPVGQQRLIFRGKVLKDNHLLSEYHVENGHTLHLVARQPAQSQGTSSNSSGETNENNNGQGSDASAGGPRNRVGQISHSVVLGTFNVGDQVEGVVPDLTRVIGAVLNSLGIGNQMTANGVGGGQANVQANAPVQAPQGNGADGTRGNVGGQSQAGNQAQGPQTIPLHSLPQVMQIPLSGSAVPIPSLLTPMPDSLHTLSEFMNRMEQAFSRNGYQSNPSPTNTGDMPTVELPSNARGMPTPEALGIVLRHAQRILNDHAIAALSHISGRLERGASEADPNMRSQIQTESMQVGLAMQHLGALFLELGRTIPTLRMGQSPAESFVNAGPAVFISPLGPNPIMVQPFPPQMSPFFGSPAVPPLNPGIFAPVGIGSGPRHINIHIHTVGMRASNGEGTQGENANGTGSTESGPARVLPVRNVIAATIPSRPSGVTVSSAAQPGVPVSQAPPDSASLSDIVAEVNSRIRNFVDNIRGENQGSTGRTETSSVQSLPIGSVSGNDEGSLQVGSMSVNGDRETSVSSPMCEGEGKKQVSQEHSQVSNNDDAGLALSSINVSSSCTTGESLSCSGGHNSMKSVNASEDALKSIQNTDGSESTEAVPLGLGLGGLQPKRRSRQSKSQNKSGYPGPSSTPLNLNQQSTPSSQPLLQSLASHSSVANGTDSNDPSSGQVPPMLEQIMGGLPLGGQGPDGQFDAANVMSQVLHSPALNGLLAGVSEQTGVGSPGVFRNMLEQFTQSPVMRNAVNQIAQQVDSRDLGNMFSGLGRGQGGGIDLSRMVQQMMPIVSQALGSGPNFAEQFPNVEAERVSCLDELKSNGGDASDYQNLQLDLEQVIQRIEEHHPPADIFHSVVESAVRFTGNRNYPEDLMNELCSDEYLASEYVEMLRRDLSHRLQGKSRPADSS